MIGDRASARLATAVPDTSPSGRLVPALNDLELVKKILSDTLSPAQIYPTTFFCLWSACLFKDAVTEYTNAINTGQPLCVYFYKSTGDSANGDTYDVSFPLAAGEYTLNLCYVKLGNAGIVDGYFDGTAIFTQDMYGSTVVNSYVRQSFTCASDGSHTLNFTVDGKHA